MQEVEERHDIARVCNEMECVVTLRIGDVGVRIVRDEQVDHVKVAVAGSPLHGCRNKVPTKSVDFCALREEVAACCNLGVDGGPVERSDVLRVAVGRLRFTRVNERAQNVYISPLRCDKNVVLRLW